MHDRDAYLTLEKKYVKLLGTVKALLWFYSPAHIDRLWPGPLGKCMRRLKRLAEEG